MLKHLSSHRGLTYEPEAPKTLCHPLTPARHELFDEYTRRQFAAKMPDKKNPFGNDETALKFSDFDVFKKVRCASPCIA